MLVCADFISKYHPRYHYEVSYEEERLGVNRVVEMKADSLNRDTKLCGGRVDIRVARLRRGGS